MNVNIIWQDAVDQVTEAVADARSEGHWVWVEEVEAARNAATERGDLPAAYVFDNLLEDMGVESDARNTCYSHRTWATDAHISSYEHQNLS